MVTETGYGSGKLKLLEITVKTVTKVLGHGNGHSNGRSATVLICVFFMKLLKFKLSFNMLYLFLFNENCLLYNIVSPAFSTVTDRSVP